MDLTTITVADFKDLFYRDFPYLPEYDNVELYNAGDRVYYSTTKLFYDCTVNGTIGITPGTASNWEQVDDDILNYIQDGDITRAFREARVNLNQALYGSDDTIELAYLYLTAHYLVNDIRAGLSGISAQGSFPVASKSVGSVSESYGIPASYTTDPILSFYTQSAYGLKYLSLTLPAMRGNVVSVCGATRP
jgi:hypothetical protein